jgi:hypothetical protein
LVTPPRQTHQLEKEKEKGEKSSTSSPAFTSPGKKSPFGDGLR